jgi:Ion channel
VIVISTLIVLASLGWIAAILHDGFEVMLLPRRVSREFRLTRLFYSTSWQVWRELARGMKPAKRRNLVLSWFGPSSVILLFALWAMSLIVAFGLIQWAIGSPMNTPAEQLPGFLDYLYFSGVTFFTLGFGDISPRATAGRFLAVGEAGIGFAFLAVVISYLPVFYQSFSKREVRISLLDARAGSPPTAGSMLLRLAPGCNHEILDRFLQEWEQYAAEVLESHLSFPLLSYYRSQHDNQSWLAAMTMILDSCALTIAGLKGVDPYQAQLTFAMARHTVVDLCQVFYTRPIDLEVDRLPTDRLLKLLDQLESAGLEIVDRSLVEPKLVELRRMYEPFANALATYFVLDLPPINVEGNPVDNWQTSAWMKRTRGIGKLALADPGDDHAD